MTIPNKLSEYLKRFVSLCNLQHNLALYRICPNSLDSHLFFEKLKSYWLRSCNGLSGSESFQFPLVSWLCLIRLQPPLQSHCTLGQSVKNAISCPPPRTVYKDKPVHEWEMRGCDRKDISFAHTSVCACVCVSLPLWGSKACCLLKNSNINDCSCSLIWLSTKLLV